MAVLATVEAYANNASTLLAGGYTSGSGVLNVDSTAAPFPQTKQFRVVIQDPTTKAVKVVLKVTDLNSSTQWGVTAEGTDANALDNDICTLMLTAGAMDQIRKDINGYGTEANLPSAALMAAGSRYKPSDRPWEYWHDGSDWVRYFMGKEIETPLAADYTYLNNPSTTSAKTDGPGGLVITKGNQNNWVLAVHGTAAPATPWTVELGFSALSKGGANFASFGLALLEANTGSPKFEAFVLTNTGSNLGLSGFYEFVKWNSPSSFNSVYVNDNQYTNSPTAVWLKVTNDGTNIVAYVSRNGYDYAQHSTHASTAFLSTVAGFGFLVANDNGPGSPHLNQDTYSVFHYLVY